jgi:hypothetical protein
LGIPFAKLRKLPADPVSNGIEIQVPVSVVVEFMVPPFYNHQVCG